MSAVVSDLMDKLITEIPTVTGYSTKKRIPNPYVLADTNINSHKKLAQGWGLMMGGSNINPFNMKSVNADQGFTIVLTRQITGAEEQPEILDREVKNIQTDLHELITHLSSNTVWSYTPGVIDVNISSTDPIEYFNDEKFRMISTSANFVAKIEEDLD